MRESLIPEKVDNTPIKQDVDKKLAGKLFSVLKGNNKIRTAKFSMWAKHFRLLRKLDNISEDAIIAAIEYLNQHINDDYIPNITNGRQFREKFRQLDRMMSRDISTVKVHLPKVGGILYSLKDLNWPGETEMFLPAVIQKTLNNYDIFRKKLSVLQMKYQFDNVPKDPIKKAEWLGNKRLLTHILDNHCVRGQFFTMEWMRVVHKAINWPGWSGSISNMEFREDSKLLEKLGRSWAFSYCCFSDRWDKLMTELASLSKSAKELDGED